MMAMAPVTATRTGLWPLRMAGSKADNDHKRQAETEQGAHVPCQRPKADHGPYEQGGQD